MLEFRVNHQHIERIDNVKIVSDSQDYLEVDFNFSEDWDGTSKTAYFRKNDTESFYVILKDDRITKSQHLNLTRGTWYVGVVGVRDNTRITTDSYTLRVCGCVFADGEELPNLPLNLYEQLLEKIENIHPEIDPEQIAVQIAAYMEAHPIDAITDEELVNYMAEFYIEHKEELKGEPGIPGTDGHDGIDGSDGASAYDIAVAHGFSGNEIEWLASLKGEPGIPGTDGHDGIDGSDGTDGNDGYTPVKGTDYWTDEDKAEIVNELLNSLPRAESEVY